ncbi:hypothetical protein LTR94_031176, partial [Friedmanniomyces endolithicus]
MRILIVDDEPLVHESYRLSFAPTPGAQGALSAMAADLFADRAARDAPAALRCYLALLDLAPDHADGLNNMGSLLIELDRPAEALAACRRATQAAPGNLKAWLNLGQAAEMAGALDEAQAALARATVSEPLRAWAPGPEINRWG